MLNFNPIFSPRMCSKRRNGCPNGSDFSGSCPNGTDYAGSFSRSGRSPQHGKLFEITRLDTKLTILFIKILDLTQETRRGFQLVNDRLDLASAKQNLATNEFSLYVAENNLASCSARFAMQSGCLVRCKTCRFGNFGYMNEAYDFLCTAPK
jgi:hypothetical protein